MWLAGVPRRITYGTTDERRKNMADVSRSPLEAEAYGNNFI